MKKTYDSSRYSRSARPLSVLAFAMSLVVVPRIADGANRSTAKVTKRAPPPPRLPPAPPLPSLPSVARVKVEAAKDHVLVIQDINLPRGDWRSGDLRLYVAFGAPGVPKAFDAHLLSVRDGDLAPEESDIGEPLAVERAPRRPLSAQLLLGRPQMAGGIVHVPDASLRHALATPGNMAALRLRTLLPLPESDARGGREVVVRLGISGDPPLTLGRIQLVSVEPRPWITHAEAHLCGPEADPYPLSISLAPKPPFGRFKDSTESIHENRIAPVLAVRHSSDDLCIRFRASL